VALEYCPILPVVHERTSLHVEVCHLQLDAVRIVEEHSGVVRCVLSG
jgi:hypothetical protein